jgi:DNA-directed RNA polymerase subunit RPC12/RpoP
METTGSLNISVNVKCTHCGHYFDLLEDDRLREDGWIYNIVMPSDRHWCNACQDFSEEHRRCFGGEYCCPKCGKEILIKEIEY